MATKIIPQASLLLLDKSSEVRSQALLLIEACLDILRTNHDIMTSNGATNTDRNEILSPGKHESSAGTFSASSSSSSSSVGYLGAGASADQKDSAWSSWSVLQGISKSLESAAIATTSIQATPTPSEGAFKTAIGSTNLIGSDTTTSLSSSKDVKNFNTRIQKLKDNDAEAWESDMNTAGDLSSNKIGSIVDNGHGWDDSDSIKFDDDDEEKDVTVNHQLNRMGVNNDASSGSLSDKSPSPIATPKSKGMQLPPGGGTKGLGVAGSSAKSTRVKPVVKKLSAGDKDSVNWDDF
jgi:hypothetical protein